MSIYGIVTNREREKRYKEIDTYHKKEGIEINQCNQWMNEWVSEWVGFRINLYNLTRCMQWLWNTYTQCIYT